MSQSNKIYVGNLDYKVTSEDLEEFFGKYGDTEEVKLITDRDTGRSKGFAFITFSSQKGVQDALEANGQKIGEREIRVNMAKEDDRRRNGGGGGGGAGGRGGRSGGGGHW